MEQARLEQILAQFPTRRIMVVGDFFLDKYLFLERGLSEISLETGIEAYQVVQKRATPGAAGTVVNNLRALGVPVTALGVIGDDGEGYELKQALSAQGVETDSLLTVPERFTPTYTKPMMREANGRLHELNRLDIKNRTAMPEALQARLIRQLQGLASTVDGIIVADQVPEVDCGVITAPVRQALAELAEQPGAPLITVDSRERIGLFRQTILKPNAFEALKGVNQPLPPVGNVPRSLVESAGKILQSRAGRPVFVTLGADGILVFADGEITPVPGITVRTPIDIVGAGDSVMAGLTAALCSGATPAEAAWIGNLVASVTIQQLGTTGTASREQISHRQKQILSGEWQNGS